MTQQITELKKKFNQTQEKLIQNQTTRINSLEKQMSHLNTETILQKIKLYWKMKQNRKPESGTHLMTSFLPPETNPQNLSTILLELAQMKSRQVNIETTIKGLSDELHNLRSLVPLIPSE